MYFRWKHCRGFTLVEALVVVFIISVLSSMVTLAPLDKAARELRNKAFEFKRFVDQIQQQAVLVGADYRLVNSKEMPNHYVWQYWSARLERWCDINDSDPRFDTYILPSSMQLFVDVIKHDGGIEMEQQTIVGRDEGELIVYADGTITPFKGMFTLDKNRLPQIAVISDGFNVVYEH